MQASELRLLAELRAGGRVSKKPETIESRARRLERRAIIRLIRKELRFYAAILRTNRTDEWERAVYICTEMIRAIGRRK